MRILSSFTLAAVWVAISSCTPALLRREIVLDGLPQVSQEPGMLLRGLAERVQRLQSLRSLASVSYRGPDGRAGFQEAVFVRRPAQLRLETLTRLGAILIVTANGEELASYYPRERLFFRGRSIKENVRRYVQAPLELNEVTALLLGLPPVDGSVGWVEEGGSLVRKRADGVREKITFHPAGVPIQWERIDAGGEPLLSARFYEFIDTAMGVFPSAIALKAHREGKSIEIHYEEPELNVSLPVDLFLQIKPADAREFPFESLGG